MRAAYSCASSAGDGKTWRARSPAAAPGLERERGFEVQGGELVDVLRPPVLDERRCGDDHAAGELAFADAQLAGCVATHHVRRAGTIEVELHGSTLLDADGRGHRCRAGAVSTGREVRIAVPGLADSIARLAEQGAGLRLPAAEWLLARAGRLRSWRRTGATGCWRAGLAADVLLRFPAGPASVPVVFAGVAR